MLDDERDYSRCFAIRSCVAGSQAPGDARPLQYAVPNFASLIARQASISIQYGAAQTIGGIDETARKNVLTDGEYLYYTEAYAAYGF